MPDFVPRGMGWRPSKPHFGDPWLHFSHEEIAALPTSQARFSGLPPIWDQGQIGSCTSHGILRGYLYAAVKAGAAPPMLSRLMLYYDERALEGTTDQDAGASIADGLTSMNTTGVCHETEWPYDENQFATKPPASAYASAITHESVKQAKIAVDVNQVKAVLAAGYPVIIGWTCYDSLQLPSTTATGIVPLPTAANYIVGGHCTCTNGYYDDAKRLIGFDNSWSTEWGISGEGFLSYDWFNQNLMSDFWCIYSTTDQVLPTPTPAPPPPGPTPTPTPVPVPTGMTAAQFQANVRSSLRKGFHDDLQKENRVERWYNGHFALLADNIVASEPTQ